MNLFNDNFKTIVSMLYLIVENFSLTLAIVVLVTSFALSTFGAVINIQWFYDENQRFIFDDVNKLATIGRIYIYSDIKFKVYAVAQIFDATGISVSRIRIKNDWISLNPAYPTSVPNRWLYGDLVIYFTFTELPDDFTLLLTFVFLPF